MDLVVRHRLTTVEALAAIEEKACEEDRAAADVAQDIIDNHAQSTSPRPEAGADHVADGHERDVAPASWAPKSMSSAAQTMRTPRTAAMYAMSSMV